MNKKEMNKIKAEGALRALSESIDGSLFAAKQLIANSMMFKSDLGKFMSICGQAVRRIRDAGALVEEMNRLKLINPPQPPPADTTDADTG